MPTSAAGRQLTDHFEQARTDRAAPQLAFGVWVDGEMLAAGEPDLPFRIASMTKSFTAAAILLLRDRGQLELDRPVREVLPELSLQ